LIWICFCTLTLACGNNEFSIGIVHDEFNANREELNRVIDSISHNVKADTLFDQKLTVGNEDFPLPIRTKLSTLKIQNVTRHHIPCPKRPGAVFILRTDWVENDSIFLIYNICDTVETKTGFYRRDKNLNEVWGVGENWQILKIVKYLDVDR
jgi:hypothetical protein